MSSKSLPLSRKNMDATCQKTYYSTRACRATARKKWRQASQLLWALLLNTSSGGSQVLNVELGAPFTVARRAADIAAKAGSRFRWRISQGSRRTSASNSASRRTSDSVFTPGATSTCTNRCRSACASARSGWRDVSHAPYNTTKLSSAILKYVIIINPHSKQSPNITHHYPVTQGSTTTYITNKSPWQVVWVKNAYTHYHELARFGRPATASKPDTKV